MKSYAQQVNEVGILKTSLTKSLVKFTVQQNHCVHIDDRFRNIYFAAAVSYVMLLLQTPGIRFDFIQENDFWTKQKNTTSS